MTYDSNVNAKVATMEGLRGLSDTQVTRVPRPSVPSRVKKIYWVFYSAEYVAVSRMTSNT